MITTYLKTKKPWLNPLYGVEQLADDMGMTTQQLRAACRREVHKSPKWLIDHVRIIHAKRLLNLNKTADASTISTWCGYERRSFHNAFKRHTGIGFIEYKNKLRFSDKNITPK